MTKIQSLGVFLLATAFLFFVHSHYYQGKAAIEGMFYSELVTTVSSTFSGQPSTNQPTFSSGGYLITRDRGVALFQLSVLILPLVVLILQGIQRWIYGRTQFDLAITFSAIVIFVGLLMTIARSGFLMIL